MIKDSFGRVHDYLRISLTDNCNLRCTYCMPEEDHEFTPTSKLMRADEIIKIATIFVQQGVKKIRLTGGEPLVRKDVAKIILHLAELPVELSITTNGTRIADLLPVLRQAGVKSINISLDTLRPERFFQLTKRDLFHQVKSNIDLLLDHGISVKINMVLMKGVNDDEVMGFINWTKYTTVDVRFIEFMPFDGNKWSSNQIFSHDEILNNVTTYYKVLSLPSKANDTAKCYKVAGHQGSFAVISTMTAPFCSTCNRMRLTADGKLKNCLFSVEETDLLTPLRDNKDILPLIQSTIWNKKWELGGQLLEPLEDLDPKSIRNRSMISIGG
jgi:cyclic pyranopterin phosphate synthase